ncbi:hypothetical protein D3C81_808730 [compost metagenome]
MAKMKISGRGDDLKEVARLLINENIKFKYDGENEIVSESHEDARGRDLKEFLNKQLPGLKIK